MINDVVSLQCLDSIDKMIEIISYKTKICNLVVYLLICSEIIKSANELSCFQFPPLIC